MTDQPRPPSSELNPPFSIEAEKALLGSVLINPDVFLTLSAFLKADDFFILRHSHIWSAMLRLSERREPVDPELLADELENIRQLEAIGGRAYISELANSTPPSVNAEFYGQLGERAAVRRRLRKAADEMKALAADEALDLEAVIAKAENSLFTVTDRQLKRDFMPMEEAVGQYFDRIEYLIQNPDAQYGVPSGFRDLDQLLGGFQKSDLLIFAGRPGMGKTSFLLSAAMNAARMNQVVAIFSMEMGSDQLVQRLVSMETGINSQNLRLGRLTQGEYGRFVESADRLSRMPIFFDQTSQLTPNALRVKCRRLQHEHGLDMIIVDYLQLMSAGGNFQNNRVQEISYISRALKEMARELNVPLFSASQLSRAVESRQDKRPQLSDLRESGCLSGETLVHLPDEGRYVPIRSLMGRDSFRISALNTTTYQLEPAEVSAAFCTGTKPVFRLTTRLGHTIRATGNHKFLTIDGWTRLDELAIGQHLALPRELKHGAEQTMSDSELGLLAHLIGDGCTLPRHSIQYTTREPDLAELVASLARDVFGARIEPHIKPEPGHSWLQVFLTSSRRLTHGVHNPVRDWLEPMGVFGLRSHEKRVPDKVFAQPQDAAGRFLRHLWATDGCIKADVSHPTVYYATSSPQLARDVQTLLLQQGISARLKRVSQGTKGRPQYHVIVSGVGDLSLFVQRVGAVGSYKGAQLIQVEHYLRVTDGNTNRDVIPAAIWRKYALPAMQAQGMTGRQLYGGMGTAYAGNTLYKQNVGRERAGRLAAVVSSAEIAALANSDVYWDTVVSIEPDGETDVYDLTVPEHHNFVAGNIIVHNSIEQDADVVMFLYRDVVYNKATEFPNQADVIVAKHRNGRTDTVSLYFDAGLTKFMDGAVRRVSLSE